ncbi:MAG TPA: type II toxin-antitoxin system VapC family toxin [Gammaproteobacteria bacterium]|nr:type II toxin-antitoxin system VapC family toxin [Gammaproteobacteria bacterium]
MLVIDCSITMAWLFEDEKNHKTEQILNDVVADTIAIVPPLWLLEVSNTLLVAENRKRVTPAQVSHFWKTLQALSIQFDHHVSYEQGESILNLARVYQLTSYDAAYLNTAIKHHIPLATLDKKLLDSAKACGVQIY